MTDQTYPPNIALVNAIEHNDIDTVKLCLEVQDASVYAMDAECNNVFAVALQHYFENKDSTIIKYLLSGAYPIDSYDEKFNTNDLFIKFCIAGDLPMVQHIVSDLRLNAYCDYENAFTQACACNHLHLVQYFLEDLRYVPELHAYYDWAVGNNHVSVVHYLLTHIKNIDIHRNEDETIETCISKHCNEMLEFLFCSPELSEHISVNNQETLEILYMHTIRSGNTEFFSFLTKTHPINIQEYIYDWFKTAFFNQKPSMLHMLVHDYGVRKDEQIINILKFTTSSNKLEQLRCNIEKLLDICSFNDLLHHSLPCNNATVRRPKI